MDGVNCSPSCLRLTAPARLFLQLPLSKKRNGGMHPTTFTFSTFLIVARARDRYRRTTLDGASMMARIGGVVVVCCWIGLQVDGVGVSVLIMGRMCFSCFFLYSFK